MASGSTPMVSIIVPIYNVEPYIRTCVTSLMNQDCRDIEIILVDDGSPDGSGGIIDELAQADPRIVVIHKENGGVSSARNEGLNIARGKFLMFVDGDDFVEPDYVSYFVSLMEESSCDIGVGKNVFSGEQSGQIRTGHTESLDAADVIEGIYLNHYGVAVWNKIYRRELVVSNGLMFHTDFWYAEGMLFNIMYLQYADRAVIGERRVYHVRENPESATRKFSLESQFCGLRSMRYQKEHWQKTELRIKTAWEYHYRLYASNILQGLMATDGKNANRKLCRKCIRILRTHLRIPLQAGISARLKEESILMAICPTGYIRNVYGIAPGKEDPSERIPRKLMSAARRIFRRIPTEKKQRFFEKVKDRLLKHYRPVYLERDLL